MSLAPACKANIFKCYYDCNFYEQANGWYLAWQDLSKQYFETKERWGAWVIEATNFKFEVKCHLRSHLEVVMTSEASKMAWVHNMHMDGYQGNGNF